MPIRIYGTHLDVYEADNRVGEVEELVSEKVNDPIMPKNIRDKSIIMADFNNLRKSDYPAVAFKHITSRPHTDGDTRCMDILDNLGFKSTFDVLGVPNPKYTCWAGTTIDFILLKEDTDLAKRLYKSFVYYTDASDHLPVVADFNFSDQWNGYEAY
jgi:endonuclease/exonuclease/phosphatase family metal-dependent hydrolase